MGARSLGIFTGALPLALQGTLQWAQDLLENPRMHLPCMYLPPISNPPLCLSLDTLKSLSGYCLFQLPPKSSCCPQRYSKLVLGTIY